MIKSVKYLTTPIGTATGLYDLIECETCPLLQTCKIMNIKMQGFANEICEMQLDNAPIVNLVITNRNENTRYNSIITAIFRGKEITFNEIKSITGLDEMTLRFRVKELVKYGVIDRVGKTKNNAYLYSISDSLLYDS